MEHKDGEDFTLRNRHRHEGYKLNELLSAKVTPAVAIACAIIRAACIARTIERTVDCRVSGSPATSNVPFFGDEITRLKSLPDVTIRYVTFVENRSLCATTQDSIGGNIMARVMP